MIALPSVEKLREIFDYDPETGALTWAVRPITRGRKVNLQGVQVGALDNKGYRRVKFKCDGVSVTASTHRIAFKLLTGAEPEVVDHRYGLSAGDTARNLRAATKQTNKFNSTVFKNKALPKHVFERNGLYTVLIRVRGVAYGRKTFTDAQDAKQYAEKLANELHGAFAASKGVAVAKDEPPR